MRNAAAHFDDDFGLEEPRRKTPRRSPAPKAGSGKRKRKGAKRFRFDFNMRRVVRYVAIGTTAAVVVGIMVNALVMQKSRHPAPLFGTSIALGSGAAHPAPKAAPVSKTDAGEAAPLPVAKPHVASRDADAPSTSGDPIGRLLQGGGVAPADHPDTRTVIGVQRALAKLGFPVKATGTYGPQTKKALERFEKDHHLPINDELTRRTVKVLAAESGLKIDR